MVIVTLCVDIYQKPVPLYNCWDERIDIEHTPSISVDERLPSGKTTATGCKELRKTHFERLDNTAEQIGELEDRNRVGLARG